ncbi:hypothetical protein BKA67DRAFT_677790 [Truncatella angustata]|uniref:Uncharacterized protein n=1 Tax=Truncatella angustata TaxID=152316 RepID=A0A9P8UI97_9PEZI|nr:uncharacterized protein BKA67DRAFT_677790 [Truncatella angustata]KAH6652692.1 hypothetical protein BKA67DRAFT_677790 [Truncatella angustata]KAH8195482.1 hypothetical protein TruAng_010357 [Truncatella angustata]
MPSPWPARRNDSTSPSQTLRTEKSFKRRFAFDEPENEQSAHPRSPKRRGNKSFVPFDVLRDVRRNVEGRYPAQNYGRYRQQMPSTPEPRYRRHRSVTPDAPALRELQEKYSNLQIAMHSQVVSELEAAQEELTNEVVQGIKANQLALAQLSATHAKLVAPVLEAQTKKIMISPDGTEHPEIVEMGITVAEFQKRIDAAHAELEQLWADWEEAHAEIEAIEQEVLSSEHDLPGTDEAQSVTTESEHAAAIAEFNEDIDALVEKAVGEFKAYEKEFFKKIEYEAGKIVQSFVHPGLS